MKNSMKKLGKSKKFQINLEILAIFEQFLW